MRCVPGCSLQPAADRRVPAAARCRPSLLLAFLLLAVPACDGAGPPREDHLHPCSADDGPSGAFCGALEVFENREAGRGRRLSLNIVVLPAHSADRRDDPLFFLAGGPGQAAARMADTVEVLFRRVQRHRDIVLVDQRGTGRSNPLNCPSEDTLQAAFADQDRALAKLEQCRDNLDADLTLYTTDIAMDDLDEVRQYLGYERVNLYGGSYGTRAALIYLRRHGAHVRSIVLDGAAPPGMRLPLYTARDAARAFDALLAACDADEACRRAYPSLREQVHTLMARLEHAPIRVRLTHPRTAEQETVDITARALASIVFGALYAPVTSSVLPLLLDAAAAGDFQGLVALAFAGDQSDQMSLGMQLSVLCSEDAPFIAPGDMARETAGTLFGMHLAESQLRACDLWPRRTLAPGYHDPVVSDVAALVLSGALDPVTPPSWGDAVAQHLRHSRHLVAAETGHGVATTGCGARLIADFLEQADPHALETHCLDTARRPPFFLTPAGPEPASRRGRGTP